MSALARNETLASLRTHGWLLNSLDGGPQAAPVAAATDDTAALGPQDVVILAVKAHYLPALAPALVPLLTPETVLVPALNGVPWWFFHDFGGPLAGIGLAAVDPGGSYRRRCHPGLY
ncbi:hypothetical protein NCC78_11745 [Micromonospora phytophila]|nr:hypothetical protein [Micromonospora phytophila]